MRSDPTISAIDKLNAELADIFKKHYPGIKNPLLTDYPNIHGINAHVGLSLDFLKNAEQREIERLYETTKAAKHFFTMHLNDRIFATCFVLLYGRERLEALPVFKWFKKHVHPYAITYNSSVIGLPFDFIMVGLNIEGFTDTTYCKFVAIRGLNKNFKINSQMTPHHWEETIVGTEENLKALLEYRELQTENFYFDEKLEKIENEFKVFCQKTLDRYQILLENLNSLENYLHHEHETRKIGHGASYLHLPFDDKTNLEISDFLYRSLIEKKFIETSHSNFMTLFTHKKTDPIMWDAGLNAFLKLFLGFENVYNLSFKGLIVERKDKFEVIEKCFTFKDKPKIPMHEYISSKYKGLEGVAPGEKKVLWPIIENLKKWYK
jgi:hypothetical protein